MENRTNNRFQQTPCLKLQAKLGRGSMNETRLYVSQVMNGNIEQSTKLLGGRVKHIQPEEKLVERSTTMTRRRK
jgi:hypothetical protein